MKDFLQGQSKRRVDAIVLTYVTDHGGAVVDQEPTVPPGDVGVGHRGHRAHQGHVLALDDLLVGGGGRHTWGAGQLRQGKVLQYSIIQPSSKIQPFIWKLACSYAEYIFLHI